MNNMVSLKLLESESRIWDDVEALLHRCTKLLKGYNVLYGKTEDLNRPNVEIILRFAPVIIEVRILLKELHSEGILLMSCLLENSRRKKLEYQALKKVIRIQQEAAVSRMLKAKEAAGKYSASDELSLQKAIYRTIDEADSLLGILFTKEDLITGNEENKENPSGGDILVVNGRTNPKDDKTVIEELRVVNCQLRTLISELMSKLTASENEVQALKQRVAELEAENSSLQPRFVSASDYSSPFVFSPEDELTPAVPSELPALAPLEMPNFDMSVLHKKYQSNKQG